MAKLLEEVLDQMRRHHYSYRTEQTYLQWIKQFILFYSQHHTPKWGITGQCIRARIIASDKLERSRWSANVVKNC